jgi:hypothetical protein
MKTNQSFLLEITGSVENFRKMKTSTICTWQAIVFTYVGEQGLQIGKTPGTFFLELTLQISCPMADSKVSDISPVTADK